MAIEVREVAAAMAVFAEIHGRELSEPMIKAYHGILGEDFDSASWAAVVQHVARTARFWPTPAVFLEARQEAQSDGVRDAAEQAYVDVLSRRCRGYSPHRGEYVDEVKVREVVGGEALDALRAAGGTRQVLADDERVRSFARRDFIEAYLRACRMREKARARLLPGDVRQLEGRR